MSVIWRSLGGGLGILSCICAVSCGGASLSSSAGGTGAVPAASNVVSVVVDAGPTNSSLNTLFTTVTVCVPGSTTQCQSIDHIQVDTGSSGLRLLAPVLSLTLPVQLATDGNSLVECTQFVDGYSWGPVTLADVQVSGEAASSLPVQVIGDSRFTVIPTDCSTTGPAENTVADFGANGILGIGVFAQDCGSRCAGSVDNTFYYSCAATACVGTTASLTTQVLNPVPLFAKDNNGTIIQLPSVAAQGALTLTGSLIFGIDTQTNNASGGVTVLSVDPNLGHFTTVFNGTTFDQSLIDSGSNGLFFTDSALQALKECPAPNDAGFYCPASTMSFTATLTGTTSTGGSGASTTASFSVASAQMLSTDNPTFTVFPTLAGTFPSSADTFDWGLPFYYGRRVLTAVETGTTAVGAGPYFAF
jgi:hypothetical protein